MHMADALISPAVGGTAWAATAGLIGYTSKKLRENLDHQWLPLMGVMGAFIFAAQMINFTIPATGSSGHLGGGLLLAILLGPYAGFLTLASVLIVQALFFADGGLLALGCNIINMGFFSCFVAYPLYRKLTKGGSTKWAVTLGSIAAAVIGLQLGSMGVVLETRLSGISDLPLGTFLMLMQPIHLVIGLVEGIVTAAVVLFVFKARPEILEGAGRSGKQPTFPLKGLALIFLMGAVMIGGALSWFASTHPDGLEWSLERAGRSKLEGKQSEGVHSSLARIQQRTALFPDYGFKKKDKKEGASPGESGWPAPDAGTTVAGLIGGLLTFLIAGFAGLVVRKRHWKI